MASSNQLAVDGHLDNLEANNPTNDASNSVTASGSSDSNERRDNSSLFRGARDGSVDYSMHEDAIARQLHVDDEANIPTNGAANSSETSSGNSDSNLEQSTSNANEEEEKDEAEDEDEEDDGFDYSVDVDKNNDDLSTLGSSGGSGSDSSTSSEEGGGNNGGVIAYAGGNNGVLAFAASSTNNAMIPPKPNQQKLRGKKPPACLGKQTHSKCTKAFNEERGRADYAIDQLQKYMAVVAQLQSQLKSTATTSDQELKQLRKKLETSLKEIAKLKGELVQSKSKLKDEKNETKGLKATVKSKDKELREKLAAQKEMAKQMEQAYKSRLAQEKEKLKEKEARLKREETDAKNATKKCDDLAKKMSALQEERNKLVLQLADMKSTGGGGGTKKRSADNDLETRKAMMEHASEVRLKEMMHKAVSRELCCFFVHCSVWYRSLHLLLLDCFPCSKLHRLLNKRRIRQTVTIVRAALPRFQDLHIA